MTIVCAALLVALALQTGRALGATPNPVSCQAIDHGTKYDCTFYPAGNGVSGGAPVQDASGKRVGYLNQGTNFVYCESFGARVGTAGVYNHWWAYTEANDGADGWVSAYYAKGGDNDGRFGGVPACGSAHGYPPGGAPKPTPKPTPTPIPPGQVPCTSIGAGKYDCSWYVSGDGQSGGTPVLSAAGGVVGYLHKGTNWVICQQQGAERTSGSYHNDWYGWTLSDNAGYGWANAVYASGGANDGQFGGGVPNCNGAHGSPPSAAPPAHPQPQPAPRPTPIPGSGKVSAIRQKIVSLALAQRGYAPRSGHCDRYGKNLICPGDLYEGEWCSVMATWVWEQAGINVPIFGYSGDPWYWAGPGGDGKTGGHATVYGPGHHAQPGDMVFFGTPSSSKHVAIVLKRYASGQILVMNGNDYDGSHSDGIALESTFYPSSHGDVNGTGGPVYGYASPFKSTGSASVHNARLDAGVEAAMAHPAGPPIKGQDPRGPQKRQHDGERRHPAAQQMPYVGRQITIEVTNVLRSGKYLVDVLHTGSAKTARRDFAAFLRKYRDPGTDYVVHYVKQRG